MLEFLKKNTKPYNKGDCIERQIVATILSERSVKGSEQTLFRLEEYIPGITLAIKKDMDSYIQELYSKGISWDYMVKTLIPEHEKFLLDNKSIVALLEMKRRCDEFLETQKGGGKKKKNIVKKTMKKKFSTKKKISK